VIRSLAEASSASAVWLALVAPAAAETAVHLAAELTFAAPGTEPELPEAEQESRAVSVVVTFALARKRPKTERASLKPKGLPKLCGSYCLFHQNLAHFFNNSMVKFC